MYGYASASSPVSPQMTGMSYQNFSGNTGQQYPQQTGAGAGNGSYGLSPYGGGYSTGNGNNGYGQQGYGGQPPQQVNVSEFDPLRHQQVRLTLCNCKT